MFILLLASVFGYTYLSAQDTDEAVSSVTTQKQDTPKTYEHTFPEQVTKSDYFQWWFVQNDVAGIYPRREALVKDILVDIWDVVKEGQTLALLFEPWVSGQAVSNIGLKSTIVNSQNKILADTRQISGARISEYDAKVIEAEAKILEAEAEIQEKQRVLVATRNNLDSQIEQSVNSYETRVDNLNNQLVLEQKILSTFETNLENALATKNQKIEEAQNNITQKESLLDSKIDEIYTLMIPLAYVWEEEYADYDNIRSSDLSQFFSARDSGIKDQLVQEIQKFQSQRYTLDTLSKYSLILDMNRLLINALENTVYSIRDTDEPTVTSYINKAKTYRTTLINQKETYDDAVSSVDVLEVNEEEKIQNIQQKIEEQKAKVLLAESNTELIKTDNAIQLTESQKDLQEKKLESEIEVLKVKVQTLKVWVQTLREWKKVLVTTENKQVTSAANSLATAKADLNKEYIASNDNKIISPFSWIISKRDIEIGSMVSSNMEAFRVAWVDNTLSRITKKEVKFYVPESLQDQIILDQEIYFSASDAAKSFTGTVYRISPEIDAETRAITVQAKVDESLSLSNKSSLRVTLETESLMYKIPTASIYNKDERKIVYYKKDNGKLGVQDIVIVSDDGEYSLVSWNFDSTLKVVTTQIFVK